MLANLGEQAVLFLSTPSARRATQEIYAQGNAQDISIHALREEGDQHSSILNDHDEPISIHALREEGDLNHSIPKNDKLHFYPRPPRGGRLRHSDGGSKPSGISIHALREEGDLEKLLFCLADRLFLSTPSARRATSGIVGLRFLVIRFLSTPSARRATCILQSRPIF